MDRPLRGFARARSQGIDLKKRVARVLETEEVAYGMEVARRIDIRIHRTIKKVLFTLFLQGELDRSEIDPVHKDIKVRFYWKVDTDEKTVKRISELKTQLLKDHMRYATVQKTFGPKLAIASLRALAQRGHVPLIPNSIIGPVTKWGGLNNEWSEDPIVKPYGDIDVLALQSNEERLWLGEVKMRGDLLKQVQVRNFFASTIAFKNSIFTYKGLDLRLKLFIMAPIASVSAEEYCQEHGIELLKCKKAYYPANTPKWRSLSTFYNEYKRVMGFRNLRTVPPDSLPVDEITKLMKEFLGKKKSPRHDLEEFHFISLF